MEHGFLDKYSDLNSPVHRLDPRSKILATLLFILVVVSLPPLAAGAFALCFLLLIAWLLGSRLPLAYVGKRSLVILPFVGMIALFIPFFPQGEKAGSYNLWLWQVSITSSGVVVLVNVLVKSWLSILSLILLTSTTRFPDLLQGLARLKLPRAMVLTVSFMYRYLFVLVDEIMRMQRARNSRSFGGRWKLQLKTAGNIIGTLFWRSYERGERVYVAMLSRGFEGQIPTLDRLRWTKADWYFGGMVSLCLALALWAGFGL